MSLDVDMKSYTGEILDSAAEGPQISSTPPIELPQFEEFQMPNPADYQSKTPVAQQRQEPLVQAPITPEETVSNSRHSPLEEVSRQELNFKALREEVDRIKAERESERKQHQQDIDLLRANLAQQQYQQQPAPKPKRLLEMEDGEIPNVAEINRAWEQRERDYQERLEELQVAQQYPDYAEVLNKYTAPLIQNKPHLAEGIQGSRNKAMFAYELGKLYQQQQQAALPPAPQVQAPPQPSPIAQRIVENAKKPGTLSGASGGTGTLSKAEYFATMSDSEFMQMATKHLEQI